MSAPKLPVKQLVILSICRFAEPIALTSVWPYVPELMERFGVPENEIARWAGLTSAIFSICQAFTGLIWGAASDHYGRKPIILLGLFNTMWSMLLWGFSTNLPMALTARALQGLGNGNVGILRTTVAELCPWKELQPRAFSVMPLVYTVGAIFGPTLGGALSNPLRLDPRQPSGNSLLERFPYCLPNLVAAIFFAIGIVVGWLFLQETLESKKANQDLGLRTGTRLVTSVRKLLGFRKKGDSLEPEREPLLGQRKTVNGSSTAADDSIVATKSEKPRIRDVLTYQTTLNLVVYTLLALYSIAYDQLIPVFLHHPPQDPDDPRISLPFKFSGGFGVDSRRIGAMFTFFAISSTLFQFLLFPPLARSLGVLKCLRIAFLIYPFVFFITPFVSLIPHDTAKQAVMIALLVVRGLAGTFAFPTSTIMLTNSATSLQVLGTINGVATSVSAVGRASGPAIGGGLFTWGVKRGYVIVPFWTLTVISLIASIPTWWLVEGEGFGGSDDSETEDDELTINDEENATAPMTIPEDVAVRSENEFGEPGAILSYTSTRRSSVALSDEDDEINGLERRRSSTRLQGTRSHSRGSHVRRQASIPIGMGEGLRRYSSNLGSTGVDANGTSWGGR